MLVSGPVILGNGDATGPYPLGYSNLRSDTTAIVEGQSTAANVDFVGDEDAYTFTGAAGDLATVFVDNNTVGGKRVTLTVFNPDGSVWDNDMHQGQMADRLLR